MKHLLESVLMSGITIFSLMKVIQKAIKLEEIVDHFTLMFLTGKI